MARTSRDGDRERSVLHQQADPSPLPNGACHNSLASTEHASNPPNVDTHPAAVVDPLNGTPPVSLVDLCTDDSVSDARRVADPHVRRYCERTTGGTSGSMDQPTAEQALGRIEGEGRGVIEERELEAGALN